MTKPEPVPPSPLSGDVLEPVRTARNTTAGLTRSYSDMSTCSSASQADELAAGMGTSTLVSGADLFVDAWSSAF